MGVYINGMEMPKRCGVCPFQEFYKCEAMDYKDVEEACFNKERDNNCPLVPVPPHGRLIDASEKIRVQMYDDMTEDYHIAEMTIDDLLSQGWVETDAPTIIPADELSGNSGKFVSP